MESIIVPPREGRELGNGMLCRIPSASTGGALCAIEQTLAPGDGIALHVHSRDDELYYILEGPLEMQCGDRVFVATTGAMVFIPRTIPHAFGNRTDRPIRFLNVFLPGGFDDFVDELNQLSPTDSADPTKRDAVRAKHGVRFFSRDGG
jgi:quercetin dioxygenase-like cupin family protein